MKMKMNGAPFLIAGITFIAASLMAQRTQPGAGASLSRPAGSCDVYAAAGDPCAAAHSTTRALYSSYNGPLYQVMRQSDGKTLDIQVVQPVASPEIGRASCRERV